MRWLTILLLTMLPSMAAETYLVCAGVETYDDPDISALKYAVADVTAVADKFRSAGVPDDHITVLTTQSQERLKRPTKFAVLHALQAYREQAVGDDRLIFFFAGHGMEQDGRPYLLTSDSFREELQGTALPMSTVNSVLQGFQAKNVLFIIDACRNDPQAGRSDTDAQLDDGLARGLRPKLTAPDDGKPVTAALLLACDVGQRAWEMPDAGHGAFTNYLLKGLDGAAADDQGQVSLVSLAQYVQREVASWAERAKRQQTPRFDNPGGGDFALLAVADPPENWPDYLTDFRPPAGMSWSDFRVDPTDGMPQAHIPDGAFTMGSSKQEQAVATRLAMVTLGGVADPKWFQVEGPQKQVTVSGYWMDLHEVTNEQYCRFLNSRPLPDAERRRCVALAGEQPGNYLAPQITKQPNGGFVPVEGKARYPAVWVSWDGAQAYAAWARRALPTEAQWERGARAGQQTRYVWGDTQGPPAGAANLLDESAAAKQPEWHKLGRFFQGYDDQYPTTSPVCSFAANGFGLFDMAGNVWDWCRDWFDADWYARMPDHDPVNEAKGQYRALRSGSWGDHPWALRIAFRIGYPQERQSYLVGFRCVSAN